MSSKGEPTQLDAIWHASCGVTAIRGPYLVAVGTHQLQVEQVQHQALAAKTLQRRYGRFIYVGWREAGSDVRPAPDAKSAMLEVGREFAGNLVAAALVLEGGGFLATIHRSFITAVYLAARVNFPHKVFAEPADACHWLAAHPPPSEALSEAELTLTITAARKRGSMIPGAPVPPSSSSKVML